MKIRTIAFGLALALSGPALARTAVPAPDFAVGPQYDTTHVYVPSDQFDAFVRSFVATFGGSTSDEVETQVTPTVSRTKSQLIRTPVGTVSAFGFTTPIPFPFGSERTGYLVTDIDAATKAARNAGAVRMVDAFPDPIGRDVVVSWPGGVAMQLYWHTKAPSYAPLESVPENRVYLTADAADAFVSRWKAFSHGTIERDDDDAAGEFVGLPGTKIRRIVVRSRYGLLTVFVTSGSPPWPYGRELTGYAVKDVEATTAKAQRSGAELLVAPVVADGSQTAMLRFPGGYIAEIHRAQP